MISKCANATCNRPFLYLHEGQLFAVEVYDKKTNGNHGSGFGSPPRKTQFFWICNDCLHQAGGKVVSAEEVVRGMPKPPQHYRTDTMVVLDDVLKKKAV